MSNIANKLNFTFMQAVSLSIIIFTIGIILIAITGLINGNFYPTTKETKIMLTKSPTQVIYTGPSQEKITNILNEIKGIPYVEYNFNKKTVFDISTSDVDTSKNDSSMILETPNTSTVPAIINE